jgi:hypothetical protein
MEHGLPVCRCEDGDQVMPTDDCDAETRDFVHEDTEMDECDGVLVCGGGATCHHMDGEGYYCTCKEFVNDDVYRLVGHYEDCGA